MLNILIASNDIVYVKNIMHYINDSHSDMCILDITTSKDETLERLKNSKNIDVVILDLTKIENDFKELLDYIHKKIPIFILCNEKTKNEIKKSNNLEIDYKFISKNSDLELLINDVKENICCSQRNKIRKVISKELTYVGYSLSHTGTQYLIESIELQYLNGCTMIKNLNKDVYPIIASQHNKTINNIKSNIIRATESMYYSCDEKRLIKYFNLNIARKPHVKSIINTILIKLIDNIEIK